MRPFIFGIYCTGKYGYTLRLTPACGQTRPISMNIDQFLPPAHNQRLNVPFDVQLDVKRLDLIHPLISGNKLYKLKYNIQTAQAQDYTQLLTFGGAYSNHIAATAAAAQLVGLQSIGIIRGHELAQQPYNPTLARAAQQGMQLHFVTRETYRQRSQPAYLAALQQRFPQAFIIPEGGSNADGVRGCNDILTADDLNNYDVICCAVATGATFAGLINASHPWQKIYGVAVLQADFLPHAIAQWTQAQHWQLWSDAHHDGYAKSSASLLQFINDFHAQYDCPIEPIYTGKLFYKIWQLLQAHYFAAGTRILLIHSGGLQYSQSISL